MYLTFVYGFYSWRGGSEPVSSWWYCADLVGMCASLTLPWLPYMCTVRTGLVTRKMQQV